MKNSLRGDEKTSVVVNPVLFPLLLLGKILRWNIRLEIFSHLGFIVDQDKPLLADIVLFKIAFDLGFFPDLIDPRPEIERFPTSLENTADVRKTIILSPGQMQR